MNNKILINKEHFFLYWEVQPTCHCLTSLLWLEGPMITNIASIDQGADQHHCRSYNPHVSSKAMIEEAWCSCPSLIHKPIKDMTRKIGPQVIFCLPSILLQKCSKLGLTKPKKGAVCMILETMLCATDSFEILIVHPIYVGVCISRIARSSIDFASIHFPEIRHHIEVVLCDIGCDICIQISCW
jgi:hypothetical protein